MQAANRFGQLWHSIQTWLFPSLEDELGNLDDKHREFIAAFDARQPQPLSPAILTAAIRRTVPLATTMAEQITTLRTWAHHRARPASTVPAVTSTTHRRIV